MEARHALALGSTLDWVSARLYVYQCGYPLECVSRLAATTLDWVSPYPHESVCASPTPANLPASPTLAHPPASPNHAHPPASPTPAHPPASPNHAHPPASPTPDDPPASPTPCRPARLLHPRLTHPPPCLDPIKVHARARLRARVCPQLALMRFRISGTKTVY